MKHPDQHTSDLLLSAIDEMKQTDCFELQDIISKLNKRVFGLVILLFCIPNCLPIPNIPGMSALTGIPIGIIGLSMIAGKTELWLPRFLSRRPIPSTKLAAILEKSIPYVRKLEVLLHPRLQVMSGLTMQRFLGVAFVIFATMMSLPIPFGNFLPGIAMALMAIGLIERDGVIILIGLTVGLGTLAAMFTLADTIMDVISGIFG